MERYCFEIQMKLICSILKISHLQGILLHIPRSFARSHGTHPGVLSKVMASFSADFTVISVCSVPTVFFVEGKTSDNVTHPKFYPFKFRPFH